MINYTKDTAGEVNAVRARAGMWLRDDYSFVRVSGADAQSWLHAQTTSDVDSLVSGEGQASALLDRQARLQGVFTLHRWEDEFWILVERTQTAAMLERMDAFVFIEDVSIEETGGELDQVVVQGPHVLALLSGALDHDGVGVTGLLPASEHGVHPVELFGFEVLAFRESYTGEDGYVFVVERGEGAKLLEALHTAISDLRIVGHDAREILRIEAGLPRFDADLDETHVVSETPVERDAVSYEKGCYQGQEVVARLKAYGSPKRALMGLIVEHGETPKPGGAISLDGKRIGEVRSVGESPTLDAPIALAYLDRDHRVPDSIFELRTDGDQNFTARVVLLPFCEGPSRADRARALYEEALGLFEQDVDDEDESAIPLLREAILLDPVYEDAYEVLGVILHRHHRLDEAIYYMRALAELNPDCLMAHTNLSVFYLAKGMIEAAEEEKAKSAVLEIQKLSDEHAAQELAQQERARIRAEAEERIGMFEEVLEIDPDDPVATFGLGKAYVQLHRYEEAVPHLRHATEVQKDYSAAYLDLGKCHEFLEQTDEATTVFRAGIEVASRKGDLIPMREMERRLKNLEDALAAHDHS